MADTERFTQAAKKAGSTRQVKDQNHQHNSKKAALGPNTKR